MSRYRRVREGAVDAWRMLLRDAPSRRLFAVAGVGLTVAGAVAGTYVLVTGGLGGLLGHRPHSAAVRAGDSVPGDGVPAGPAVTVLRPTPSPAPVRLPHRTPGDRPLVAGTSTTAPGLPVPGSPAPVPVDSPSVPGASLSPPTVPEPSPDAEPSPSSPSALESPSAQPTPPAQG